MTYSEYKELLIKNGWCSVARYMGTGKETACDLTHPDHKYVLLVSVDHVGTVTANASVTIPGFMKPVSTGSFGSPWSNKAFMTQCRRLEKIKRIIGEALLS